VHYAFPHIPDTSAPISSFNSAKMNDRGQIGFIASLDNGRRGVFRGDVNSLATIGEEGGFLSGIDGESPELNNAGVVLFKGWFDLRDVNGQAYSRDGLFAGMGGGFPGVVAAADRIDFDQIGSGRIDDSGSVVFVASRLMNRPLALPVESGVYKATSAGYQTIASATSPRGVNAAVFNGGVIAARDYVAGTTESRIRVFRDGEPTITIANSGGEFQNVLDPIHVTPDGKVVFAGRTQSLNDGIYVGHGGSPTLVVAYGELFPGSQFGQVPVVANDCEQIVTMGHDMDGVEGVLNVAPGVRQRLFGSDDTLPSGVVLHGARLFDVNNLGQIAVEYHLSNGDGGLGIATPISGRPGDFNHDGRVNRCDVVRLMTQFAKPGASWNDGDFDGDQRVSLQDLVLVASNFDAPSAPSSVAVPEPSSVALAVVLLTVVAAVARRQRRVTANRACEDAG
jgi:hypothetical protein